MENLKLGESLKQFILDEENHGIALDYWKKCYLRYTTGCDKPIYKLRALLIDALNAGGIGNYDQKKETCLKIMGKIKHIFRDGQKAEFSQFYCKLTEKEEITDNNEVVVENLHNALKKYKQLGGGKKAAMFLKNLIMFSGEDIFVNFYKLKQILEKYLLVPVDTRIKDILKIYFKNDSVELDYKTINDLARRELKYKRIYLDDLWFWGRFALSKNKLKLYKKGNAAIIYTDFFLNDEYILKNKFFEKILKFCESVNKLSIESKK